ncbi:MAG: amidophosphoribosyltransferase [Gemmatimonadota bacterium]
MGGFFGVVSESDCVADLFYGTDYHSHLGTMRGGMAVLNGDGFQRSIHDITNTQFRSKFEDDLRDMAGPSGIGVISDNEAQPLLINSRHGTYGIVTVGRVNNLDALVREALESNGVHFSEMTRGKVNPTELVAHLIDQGETFQDGIRLAQEKIEGSCSLLILNENGLIAARDRLGRTPIVLGKKHGARAVTFESCALPNLGYTVDRFLGPGEVVHVSLDGVRALTPPGDRMRICAFLWVYYGYPASSYEEINVEAVRYRCGAALQKRDDVEVDLVAGIPDSGTGHAIGYANASRRPYGRPFVKYTPTWPRSFMPQDQRVRDLVARMKLIPIRDLMDGNRILFCEDSIVRGTQLQDIIQRVFDYGAREVHMRPACPPLVYGCKFLNFSQSRSEMDLAGRRAAHQVAGGEPEDLSKFTDPDSPAYCAMVEAIRERLGLTSLRYQRLDDLVEAIGLPKEKLCTYCWDGVE